MYSTSFETLFFKMITVWLPDSQLHRFTKKNTRGFDVDLFSMVKSFIENLLIQYCSTIYSSVLCSISGYYWTNLLKFFVYYQASWGGTRLPRDFEFCKCRGISIKLLHFIFKLNIMPLECCCMHWRFQILANLSQCVIKKLQISVFAYRCYIGIKFNKFC